MTTTSTASGTAAATPANLWRHNDFMKLWIAQTISLIGSQVTLLALPLTAILMLNASALQIGLLMAAQYLPFLLVGLPAGVWVDRRARRPILIITDLGRAVILLAVPLAYLLDVLALWMFYPVGFLAGVLTVFFDVAHQSYLPSLVDKSQLVDGNGKLEVSYQGAQLAGPGLGGLLIQILSAPIALLADAISYLVSAVFLWRIRRAEPIPDAPLADTPSLISQIGVGLRYVLGSPLLRPVALATAIGNLFGIFGLVQAVFVLFAVRQVHLSAAEIGLVLAVANAGALAGALLNNRLVRRFGLGMIIVTAVAAPGVAILVLSAATPAIALPVLMAGLTLAWFGIAVYNVNQISLRQAVTPPSLQGRMNATMRFLIWGTIPLGTAAGGLLGGLIGLRPTLVLAGLGSLLATLPLLGSPVRRLREIPGEEGQNG
jgi:MFS family permease